MRVVKEAEERKNEILDAAENLFASKGFDNTSIDDILDEVRIARGTLYYHYKSKEDILDAVIERIVTIAISKATKIAKTQQLPLLEKLTKTVMALNVESKIGAEVMHQVHKPQNALMHHKMRTSLLSGIVPIITWLTEEGILQGILHTDFPKEAVEMIMVYSNITFDQMVEQTQEEREQRIYGFIYNVERLFGASEGSMKDAIMEIFMA